MHMLYDSDSFVVVRMLAEHSPERSTPHTLMLLPRHGFEIVDKRSGKEVYLDGAWAELFQQEVQAWERADLSSDEIEATLERYAELAQNPVLLH